MPSRPTARPTPQRNGDASLGEMAARYGFRRVERVHVRSVEAGTTATVVGVTHRYPRSIRVPLSVARRLVVAGAPLTVDSTAADDGGV